MSNKEQEVAAFFKKHSEKVGHEQAVRDFQKAINNLRKFKPKLKEDGYMGEKTYEGISYICQYYPVRLINKFIRRAAINNVIFDTKNNERINTEKKVEKIYNNLLTDEEKMI